MIIRSIAGSAAAPHRSRGQALAEFALVLPILAILLFGTIQAGITFGSYNGLINSVREAARFGSVCIGDPVTVCGPSTRTYLTGTKIPGSVFGYKGTPTAMIEYQAYNTSTDVANPQWNLRIRVSGCANGTIFIPLIGYAFGLSDPTSFPLRAVETFRVEGNPAKNPPLGIAKDTDTPPADWTPAFGNGACK